MKKIIPFLLFFTLLPNVFASGKYDAPKKKIKIPYFNLQQGKITKIEKGKDFKIITVKKKDGLIKVRVPSQELFKGDLVEFIPGKSKGKIPFTPYLKVLNRNTNHFVPKRTVKFRKKKSKEFYTVSELFTNKEKLDGKTIKISGEAVKIAYNIKGKNWIHLQDGTGGPGEYDITITTDKRFPSGERITVEGKLMANQSLGGGYFYPILIDGKKISLDDVK